MISGNDLRQKFVEYFKDKLNHNHLPSSSLIPDNPTVLLTPAGMLQFVPVFLGYQDPPDPPRVVTYQKCARAGGKDSDIENVGRTPRHHTFFEMLGNFSFGDYFKHEVIPWAWQFVTDDLGLDKQKLWATVFENDDESFEIWNKTVGIPEERILRCGKKDNFWGPPGPTGPCGPCTELHYDLGEDLKCGPNCKPNACDCDRWVEIWNLVLMELYQDEEGNHTSLEKKNVDTGMGLERIAMVCQNKRSTFETDLLKPILDKVCNITGKQYNKSKKTDVSLRIITDHARCVTFMVADGLTPGNVGRNYVLRMILRRALRHGKILGVKGTFLHTIVNTVIDLYKNAYPEIDHNREKVIDIIKT
ncbi:MAG: alanine--tRNA ligase-related protein, partial [Cyanobacteriota bacterium]